MKPRDLDPETFLDQAIAAARDEAPDPAVVQAAAARVRERLAREAAPAPAPAEVGRIGSCADYQALIPAYLAGELPPARALLVEDHTRECVPCHRAAKAARGGIAPAAARRPARPAGGFDWRWAGLAAGLLLAVGLAGGLLWLSPLGTGGEVAQVRTVEGQLFRLAGETTVPLAPGDPVGAGERIRTGRGSGAVVRLADGSSIELRERSEISLAPRRGEVGIRVDRGSIIVQAAKQHGHLYASTDDCLVAVTGTIFAVNHGTKGSRVSVIEGEVRVEQGRSERLLRPGEQVVTHAGLAPLPIEQEIAWSRDRDRYVALLAELKALDVELGRALARSGLRYESRLLGLVPADTAVYLAMPNVSSELTAMHRILEERMGQSEVLSRFWQERMGRTGLDQELAEIVRRIGALGEHLGPEIVAALALEDEEPGSPLVLAEVVNPAAFAAVLADEVERINATPGGPRLVLIQGDPAGAPEAAPGEILLWAAGDLFAASPEVGRLAELAALLGNPGGNPFTGTPFHARLAEAYSHGAQWLAGVDLATLLRGEADEEPEALAFSGFDRVEHLIVERKEHGEVAHTGAVLSFAGPRGGVAAWLAAPAPMGGLDFVSAEAQFASAFVVEDPATIVDQTFRFLEAADPDFREELARFESEHGISIRNDLAAPLGGEVTVALDGPALPVPSWKVVAEVYDPARLEQAIEWAVAEANRAAAAAGRPPLVLDHEDVGGRTFHRLHAPGHLLEVNYTFEGGYFLAAPSRALVERALQVRESGYGLVDSPEFTALLPEDGFLDFSALVWSNLGPLGDAFLGAVGGNLTDEQRQAIDRLDLGAPTLTCAYGEPDRIRIVSTGRGGLLGSRLGALLGLGALVGGGGQWVGEGAPDAAAGALPDLGALMRGAS